MNKWQKFHKITSVGMGAAKAMKQGRNGNVGEFQAHDYFIFFNLPSHDQFRLCARLILIQSQRCFKQYYL